MTGVPYSNYLSQECKFITYSQVQKKILDGTSQQKNNCEIRWSDMKQHLEKGTYSANKDTREKGRIKRKKDGEFGVWDEIEPLFWENFEPLQRFNRISC